MNEPGRNNSIHGLLWDKAMTVQNTAADNKAAVVTLGYTFNNASDPG